MLIVSWLVGCSLVGVGMLMSGTRLWDAIVNLSWVRCVQTDCVEGGRVRLAVIDVMFGRVDNFRRMAKMRGREWNISVKNLNADTSSWHCTRL